MGSIGMITGLQSSAGDRSYKRQVSGSWDILVKGEPHLLSSGESGIWQEGAIDLVALVEDYYNYMTAAACYGGCLLLSYVTSPDNKR